MNKAIVESVKSAAERDGNKRVNDPSTHETRPGAQSTNQTKKGKKAQKKKEKAENQDPNDPFKTPEKRGSKRRPEVEADDSHRCEETLTDDHPEGSKRRAADEGDDAHRGDDPTTTTPYVHGVQGAMGVPADEAQPAETPGPGQATAGQRHASKDESMDNVERAKCRFTKGELEWKHIGSGAFVRTFPRATRLRTSSA